MVSATLLGVMLSPLDSLVSYLLMFARRSSADNVPRETKLERPQPHYVECFGFGRLRRAGGTAAKPTHLS